MKSLPNVLALLVMPPGVGAFLMAILFMMIAHGLLMGVAVDLIDSIWFKSGPFPFGVLVLVWISCLIYVHPTFLVTRGGRGAHRFLKVLSLVFVLIHAAALVAAVVRHDQYWWLALVGTLLSLIPMWAYRTESFHRFVEHFAMIQQIGRELREEARRV